MRCCRSRGFRNTRAIGAIAPVRAGSGRYSGSFAASASEWAYGKSHQIRHSLFQRSGFSATYVVANTYVRFVTAGTLSDSRLGGHVARSFGPKAIARGGSNPGTPRRPRCPPGGVSTHSGPPWATRGGWVVRRDVRGAREPWAAVAAASGRDGDGARGGRRGARRGDDTEIKR